MRAIDFEVYKSFEEIFFCHRELSVVGDDGCNHERVEKEKVIFANTCFLFVKYQ